MSNVPVQDQKVVRAALATLPTRISTAKDQEMGEMMGKLKEVCCLSATILRLITDMFGYVAGKWAT